MAQFEAILQQLELNQSFFVEFFIIAALFSVLGPLFFKPFMNLLAERRKRTVDDREEAAKLMAEAEAKFEEYKKRMADERTKARHEYELLVDQAKKEEALILGGARAEAKKITQEAADSIQKQREALRKQLDADVESLAQQISEKLLSRKD